MATKKKATRTPLVSKFINKKTREPLKIMDMLYAIPWKNIEEVMYAKDYRKFCKFMTGQTTNDQGAFICDVESFLFGLDNND